MAVLQVQNVELVQTDLVAGLLPRLAGAVDLLVGRNANSSCWRCRADCDLVFATAVAHLQRMFTSPGRGRNTDPYKDTDWHTAPAHHRVVMP